MFSDITLMEIEEIVRRETAPFRALEYLDDLASSGRCAIYDYRDFLALKSALNKQGVAYNLTSEDGAFAVTLRKEEKHGR